MNREAQAMAKYTIHSEMLAQLRGNSPSLFRCVMSYVLLPFCYLGLILSVTAIFSIPFRIIHDSSSFVFWLVACLIGALFLWMFRRVLTNWLRLFRQRVLYVEAALFFATLLLVMPPVIWLYLRK